MLIGVLASSIRRLFISEELIRRVIPGRRFARLFIAALLGILFPICACGIVLVAAAVMLLLALTQLAGFFYRKTAPGSSHEIGCCRHVSSAEEKKGRLVIKKF